MNKGKCKDCNCPWVYQLGRNDAIDEVIGWIKAWNQMCQQQAAVPQGFEQYLKEMQRIGNEQGEPHECD